MHPRDFRFAPEDEASIPLSETAARLDRDCVIGAEMDGALIGIGGLGRVAGAKLDHRALLWGMYVRAAHRGTGVADAIMAALLDHARGLVDSVVLTVVDGNPRAQAFYARWGFAVYGTDPGVIRLPDGDSLDEILMIRHLR
ncbi:N-acetyltransferase [Oceanicola sp. 22II-s10i]|uniref:GNAT family N-acetyltransferase n=1 Tax=Oceanicola sp. 22II-s10i TaxID=1317116 RepID=UPI0020CCE1F6|nr:GNAT family N-acetyltransferase [Oceanicola sp. 22II-s10i]